MSEDEITNEDRQNIYEAAKQCGFIDAGHSNRLYCTLDQLVVFAASVADEAIEQTLDEIKGYSR